MAGRIGRVRAKNGGADLAIIKPKQNPRLNIDLGWGNIILVISDVSQINSQFIQTDTANYMLDCAKSVLMNNQIEEDDT